MTSPSLNSTTDWDWRRIGSLSLGVLLAGIVLLLPGSEGLTPEGQRLAAATVLMATWWVLQPIPLAVTSLLPLAIYPCLGIASATAVSRPYADPSIFMFFGGFLIALAIERSNLHRRIALRIVSHVGGSLRMIVFGFMMTTAVLSAWISNTACAMLMLPIALALVKTFEETLGPNATPEARAELKRFTIPLLLGIAYAASAGGFVTLIGTPTNLSLRGFWDRQFVPQGYASLSFAEWMIVFVPMSAALLISAGIVMTWRIRPFQHTKELTQEFFRERLQELGKATTAERRVFVIFLLTALMWIFRQPLVINNTEWVPGWPNVLVRLLASLGIDAGFLPAMISDSTIAIAMGCLPFILTGNKDEIGIRRPIVTWEDAHKGMPWGMLLLLGGGFAMADAFTTTKLSDWIGMVFSSAFQNASPLVLLFGLCTLVTVMTEFTSNTATINTLLPTLAAMSVDLNIDPRLVLIPATISATCGFMLPVGTPPNAIVFGTGRIPLKTMLGYGLVLNILAIIYVPLFMWFYGSWVMHIPLPGATP